MKHGPDNTAFLVCGSLLLLICFAKVPALIRRRHDVLLRSAVLLLFVAAFVFFLSAPESIAAINRFTGVPNAAAPLAYSALTGFSAASLLLIINWRPAPPERTQRATRVCVTAYSLVIFAINALFWAGDTPVEQLTLFDGYYASTPYIREMILTYLISQGVATMTTSVLCWRWSKEVRGSLRAGLLILVPAYLLHVVYDVMKLIAIGARWTGHNLDFLIDQAAPQAAAPSALLVVAGFFLPLVGPRVAQTVDALRQLRVLAPLWQELRHLPTPGAVSLPWWSSPAVRLTARKTGIYDALRALAPYSDLAVREKAYRAALSRGEHEDAANAIADATMIAVASRAYSSPGTEPAETVSDQSLGQSDLIPLAEALASPIVDNARQHRRPTESNQTS
ncbi:MAB_1171c family putative transporter [Streptomyces flaveolus]|uniref:MAB_1171c family putative transporter n=1 Tax=Streptomyces flaveolus TaxID=67297 RepID=UPI0036FC541C